MAKSRKLSEPHRRHHDTLRASGKIPILKRAQTQPRLEDTANMRLVRKSEFGRYVCNGVVSGAQQMSTTTNTIYSALWMRSKNCYLTSPKGNSMDTGLLLPLAVFALTLAVSPGGATTLATSSGAQFGFRRSITLMVGISAGLAALAAIAGAGLSGLLMAAPSLQLAMKVIGTAYLLWLASKIANSGRPNLLANMTNPLGFAAGVSLLWVNPKVWAMVTGAAAAFAGLTSHPVELAAVLGIAFRLAAAVSQSIWCVAGILLAKLLKTERQWRAVNTTLGVLLAASTIPIGLT